jgi:nitrogen regulatory protein P-II 1
MYLILYVSKDVTQAEEMLDVWIKAGIRGATILESSGLTQSAQSTRSLREDFGLVVSLRKLLQPDEVQHRTLFSAIPDEATLQKVVAAANEHVGDWNSPDVGVLFVLPILQAYGLNKTFNTE